jgi:hypothetical protein
MNNLPLQPCHQNCRHAAEGNDAALKSVRLLWMPLVKKVGSNKMATARNIFV